MPGSSSWAVPSYPVGGHNILEPASFNRAIITGPFMENFREELALMRDKDAIIQVSSFDELQQQLATLLDDDDRLQAMQQNTALLSHDVEQVLQDYSELDFRFRCLVVTWYFSVRHCGSRTWLHCIYLF